MRNTLLALLSLLLIPSTASADAVAYSCQDKTTSDRVEVITDRGACAGFVVKGSGGQIVKRIEFGILTSGVLVSSADGRRVVMVQTNLYAGFEKGTLTTYGQTPVVAPRWCCSTATGTSSPSTGSGHS